MRFEELLDSLEPKLAEAFRRSIEAIKSNAILARVVERLERGDVNGAVAALQIEPEAFAALDRAILEAYNAGGVNAITEYPAVKDPEGNRVLFSFGVRNEAGEAAIRAHALALNTSLADDVKDAARLMLSEGLAQGRNPVSTALDMVGRKSRVTGLREGGIIGLSSAQTAFVEKYRNALLTGDTELMKAYLLLGTRDKRSDAMVRAAIASGKPLSAAAVQGIIGRLSDNNLRLRGESIARTETMMALGMARDDAMRQQINSGKVAAQDVTKKWHSAADGRVRHTHRILNGQSVPIDGVFHSPSGATLRYPGDPNAPINETSGCRCYCSYEVGYLEAVIRRYRAQAA
jgi:hypothetical protein